MPSKKFWKIFSRVWLPILRFLEKLHFHNKRQNYPIGFVRRENILKIKQKLANKGYENDVFAWKDPGEVLNMRKLDNKVFNYHIRIFNDGEVRGHYEYASEAHPFKHIFESCFMPKKQYFRLLLGKYLI